MGDRVRRKGGLLQVGEAIVRAWEEAGASGNVINRQALIDALTPLLDPSIKNGRKRNIEFDVIFDDNVDGTTRMVWLSIPTPDPKLKADNTEESWQEYIDREFGSRASRNNTQLTNLATAVLFGCGR
jgi:hypothetical protein